MRRTALLACLLSIGLSVSLARGSTSKNAAASNALDVVQPDLKFTNISLADGIEFLRDTSGANIVVDWRSLEAVNVTRETLINVRLRNVSLRKALNVMLAEAGAGNLLTFYTQDNVLEITTQAKADSILYTKVYPVGDLLVEIPNYQPTSLGLSSISGIGGSTGGGNSGGGNLFGGSSGGSSSAGGGSGGAGDAGPVSGRTIKEKGDDLVKLIEDTIRPEIWRENGGSSTIRFFHNSLIVTAPLSVHEAIGGPVD